MGWELLKCVLSQAATSARTLNLDFGVRTMRSPRAAIESDGAAVLVIGDVLQIRESNNLPRVIVLCDDDSERLARSHKILCDMGAMSLKTVRAPSSNLRLDLDQAERWWRESSPTDFCGVIRLLDDIEIKARSLPAIADDSFGTVYSCETDKRAVEEVFRVLCKGGVARFRVLLSDQQLDPHDPQDFNTETGFLRTLENSSYYGITITARSDWPALVENGTEWRVHIIDALKGKEGPCLDRKQAVIYRGPWRKVFDDDGHVFERGVRTAVCDKTFSIMKATPYGHSMAPVDPYVEISLESAPPFRCGSNIRDISESKGLSTPVAECCPSESDNPGCC